MARDARDRDRRRHADENQQRRHQEAAADAEHAGDEADREPHPQHQEDVHGQVGDRKIDLQRGVIRRLRNVGRSVERCGNDADRTTVLARNKPPRRFSVFRRSPMRESGGDAARCSARLPAAAAGMVPAAGRRRHVDGLSGCASATKLLTACCAPASVLASSRLGDLVALFAGFLVALGRGQREPFVGFGHVVRRRRGRARRGRRDCTGCRRRRASPPCGTIARRRCSPACRRRLRHRARRDCAWPWRCPCGGGGEIELARACEVLFHALALFQQAGVAELRRRQALGSPRARTSAPPPRMSAGTPRPSA